MANGKVVGLECVAAVALTGSFATPTWTEMANTVDLTINLERTKITAPTRGSTWEKVLLGLKKGDVSFNMVRDNADTCYLALRTAWENNTDVIMGFFDGPTATAGTIGLKGEFKVTKLSHGEPLEGAATVDVEIAVSANSTNDPTWVTQS